MSPGPVAASLSVDVVLAVVVDVVLVAPVSSATLPRLPVLLVVVEVLLVWPAELLEVDFFELSVELCAVGVLVLRVAVDLGAGLRQKINHNINQTIPAMIKNEMISHRIRPSNGLLFCSYILVLAPFQEHSIQQIRLIWQHFPIYSFKCSSGLWLRLKAKVTHQSVDDICPVLFVG